jgi:hypothetical protein
MQPKLESHHMNQQQQQMPQSPGLAQPLSPNSLLNGNLNNNNLLNQMPPPPLPPPPQPNQSVTTVPPNPNSQSNPVNVNSTPNTANSNNVSSNGATLNDPA